VGHLNDDVAIAPVRLIPVRPVLVLLVVLVVVVVVVVGFPPPDFSGWFPPGSSEGE
jgi:hypothetical protein